MKKTLLYLILALGCTTAWSQEKYTLNGYIKDASNGETLIGATVYIPSLAVGAVSNEYGFYSISVAEGTYEVDYGYLGFETKREEILLDKNIKLDIELQLEINTIEEVVVSAEAEDKNVTEVQMSTNKLDIQTIKSMPSLLGEVEVIRSLQLLPGVTSVGEGSSGFNVRGGSIDQNLVLLDEAPVYNSSHLFGFFSVFNPDAVKDVKLYKGGIPPRYGGRLSSILDVRMKEGNSKNLSINGGIGFIFSRLSVEAPIIKDKASFIVAARRSYIDILAKPFLDDDFKDSALNFYDLTLKTNYNINEKNRLFLSGYFGRDNFGFGNQAGFNWGNSTGTIRWNHLFSDRLFSNLTLYYSDYDYEIKFGEDANNSFNWDASIENYSIKPEFSYFLTPNNILRFGGQGIYYTFEPGNAIGISEGEETNISQPFKYAVEAGAYIENELDFDAGLKILYGARLSYFNYLGKGTSYEYGEAEEVGKRRPPINFTTFDSGETIQDYFRFEPRLSIKQPIGDGSSIKASYNRTAQFIHLLSNTTASTPVDVWTPSTNNIKPQLADQVALGYFTNLSDNTYELSSEIYYKKMSHLVDYIDGADLIFNSFLEGDLLEGKGRAYGLELQLSKKKGRLHGWASYTLSKTERQVLGINNNEWYPARFDQTHNLSLTGFYEINDRWSMSANFAYITGSPTTLPTSRAEVGPYVVAHNANNSRNNIRIPDYHRLDISFTRKGKQEPGKKFYGEWVFSVYNLYNRRNPFSIYASQQNERVLPGQVTKNDAIQLAVIGNFIPSVSYNFKFN